MVLPALAARLADKPSTAPQKAKQATGLAVCNLLASTRSRRDASRAEATPPTASGKRQRRVVARPLGSGRWLVALALAAIFIASRDPQATGRPTRSPRATSSTPEAPRLVGGSADTASKQQRHQPWRECRTSTRPSPRYLPCRRAPSPSRGCSTTPCRACPRASRSRGGGATGAPCGAGARLTSTATPRTTRVGSSRAGRPIKPWIRPK